MKSFVIGIITLLFFGSATRAVAQKSAAKKEVASDTYTYRSRSADGIGKFYFGREIAHIMGSGNATWLERSSRPEEENTDLAIEKMNLKPADVIADIGAGTGYYTFKIAPKVPDGKVYAVEVQDGMITFLNNRKKELNNNNVEVVKGGSMSPNLPANSIDMVVMVDVYHELENPAEILQAIKKSLKKDGKILLIEYKGEDPSVRIKPLHKTTVAQLNKELGANGFKLSYRGDFLPIQHFLLYKMK
ncbi:MAG: class I SAM-dependent methyltransferase [Segetibacter sp.]